MPILLWVVFPFAVWSACLDKLAPMSQLAPVSKRSARPASRLIEDREDLRQ
jgi:hypothetical protein